ncbi:MAG: hypothetical protein FD171_1561 [Actinobacteria bacterium]|nr:MAG: hypothetical protein FD171_1561 [Actinomycetota bacterium]
MKKHQPGREDALPEGDQATTDSKEFPRVLIVGQSFNGHSGGGITLTNHFRGWPSDRVAVATTAADFPDFMTCSHYYHLGSSELKWVWPLSLFSSCRDQSGRVAAAEPRIESSSAQKAFARESGGLRKVVGGIFRTLVAFLGLGEFLVVARPSVALLDWIAEFCPDVIYTQLASVGMIRLVHGIVERTELPLVVHIMDDWPSVLNADGVLGPLLNRRSHSEFRGLLRRTSRLVAISGRMAEVYSSRYGREVGYSHNPIDIDVWTQHAKSSWAVGVPFRFVYAGRVGRANARSLADVAAVIADLRSEGADVVLEVYTQDAGTPLADALSKMGVLVKSALPHGRVPELLGAADAVVLPLDFDDAGFAFSSLSMPTKTAEYMASGAPMLVYAPRGGALAEYARSAGECALLVDTAHDGRLADAVLAFVNDENLRASLGRHAKIQAIKEHDAVRVRENFRSILASAARDGLAESTSLRVRS